MRDSVPRGPRPPSRRLRMGPDAFLILFLGGAFAWVGLWWWLLEFAFPGFAYNWFRVWLLPVVWGYGLAVGWYMNWRYGVEIVHFLDRKGARSGAGAPQATTRPTDRANADPPAPRSEP